MSFEGLWIIYCINTDKSFILLGIKKIPMACFTLSMHRKSSLLKIFYEFDGII